MLKLNKIYFMFHPVCWAHAMNGDEPPPGVDRQLFLRGLEWEKRVNERQRALMREMKPDEALLIFPVGTKQPMVDLEKYALSVLGDRCIIVRRNAVAPPRSWLEMPNAIERFLNDPDLEGKSDFLKDVPPEIQSELESEIREACEARGYGWDIGALKVVYYSRLAAMDIAQQLSDRGIELDPSTVECEAFGEGFEQCAMTWKAMLIPYLGLYRPAENNFDLSVSGVMVLQGAILRERVALRDDSRLFLWEAEDGRPIGLYARAWCRLRDAQLYARLPLHELSVEVWDMSNTCCSVEGSHLDLPVLNAIRRDPSDNPLYLVGNDLPFSDFRRRLIEAEIIEK